jgi:hypothetical protein
MRNPQLQATSRPPGLLRQIGFFSATALVISNMVGTGIFGTTGYMAGQLGSARLILACWCGFRRSRTAFRREAEHYSGTKPNTIPG